MIDKSVYMILKMRYTIFEEKIYPCYLSDFCGAMILECVIMIFDVDNMNFKLAIWFRCGIFRGFLWGGRLWRGCRFG